MKVAIVHDWLTTWAGAEKALAELLACYPQAEIFTTVNFLPVEAIPSLAGRKIHTSFIQRLPGARKHYRRYLPLMPLAVEQFDLKGFDLILSSSHAVAKGADAREEEDAGRSDVLRGRHVVHLEPELAQRVAQRAHVARAVVEQRDARHCETRDPRSDPSTWQVPRRRRVLPSSSACRTQGTRTVLAVHVEGRLPTAMARLN